MESWHSTYYLFYWGYEEISHCVLVLFRKILKVKVSTALSQLFLQEGDVPYSSVLIVILHAWLLMTE